jgi:hypothetical protein
VGTLTLVIRFFRSERAALAVFLAIGLSLVVLIGVIFALLGR